MSKLLWIDDYSDASPEQRLAIIRSESLRYIARISGYAATLKENMSHADAIGSAQDTEKWIDTIIESANELDELIKRMTDS